ncbi:hemerythrin [Thiogranum longum]|uniref:Hemerythrin n=1 Tax=Thiogranum longum TaxID=1537524 RepID=A0A4R1H618_9GAMM|nr:bacteriohemerythrin [Thiogranum longum]TCK17177.1 hemerythrin [Thiogranum longum]
MSLLTWSDDRLLGIDSLDDQHKTLVDCINKLVTECRKTETDGPGPSGEKLKKLARLFDDLYTTTKAHFSHEEAMMRDMAYPGYTAHAREHVMLIAELKTSFAKALTQQQCSLTPELLQALKSWLIAHVSHSDRDFAKFFHEKHHTTPLPESESPR